MILLLKLLNLGVGFGFFTRFASGGKHLYWRFSVNRPRQSKAQMAASKAGFSVRCSLFWFTHGRLLLLGFNLVVTLIISVYNPFGNY